MISGPARSSSSSWLVLIGSASDGLAIAISMISFTRSIYGRRVCALLHVSSRSLRSGRRPLIDEAPSVFPTRTSSALHVSVPVLATFDENLSSHWSRSVRYAAGPSTEAQCLQAQPPAVPNNVDQSGILLLELWVSQSGRTWSFYVFVCCP